RPRSGAAHSRRSPPCNAAAPGPWRGPARECHGHGRGAGRAQNYPMSHKLSLPSSGRPALAMDQRPFPAAHREDLMSFKVAIIGAGSIGFTKTLISDLLMVPEFADVEFALTDINPHNLDMIRQIIETVVSVNKLPAKVSATTDRREALSGARYIIS